MFRDVEPLLKPSMAIVGASETGGGLVPGFVSES